MEMAEAGQTGSELNMYLSEEQDVLDLTGNQLKDLVGIPLPDTLTEVDLTSNRLSAIDSRIGDLGKLEKISFRQNLITDSAAAELNRFSLLTSLRELVLRDNLLKRVPRVSSLKSLVVYDVSYNSISSMAGVGETSDQLLELYLSNNKISKIEELETFSRLRLLELGSNKIRVMEGLGNLTSLQELWLGRNKIREVNLCGLTSLVKISVQSNRLTSLLGFEACTLLQELYLSNNGIDRIEGLSSLTNLRILDLAANRICKVEGLDTLTRLEDLWLNDNQISSLEELMEALKGPRLSLVTLYLERNPCVRESKYIESLTSLLPKIEEIDSVAVQ